MTDTALGFVLLGVAMLVVLGVVFVVSSRGGGRPAAAGPPPGVHMPSPSFLPVLFSVAAVLLGAGLAFKGEEQLANPFLAIPGLVLLLVSAVGWVRAANHEWREVEHGAHHDDGSAH